MIAHATRFRTRQDSELGTLFVCLGCRSVFAHGDEAHMALHRCDPADLPRRRFPWVGVIVAAVLIAVAALAVLLGLMRAAGAL